MQLRLYNTLSRQKEIFIPIKQGQVSIYSCGPTVYKYAHAGNMRAYIFVDSLVRVLKYAGYKVKSVMNITDVGHLQSDADEGEDKMNKSAQEEDKSPLEIAKFYTDAFMTDFARLNILTPTIMPRATDNIQQMQEIVADLLAKGYAYQTSDGIYYDISKFSNYGKLSGINLDEQLSGARVEINSEKRHPADFALWKSAQPNHIQQWDSPWGRGFPGWHIECSAMSKRYLGEVFDIHTGGVDHIPIHHENEIAQSEAWLGKKTTNYWLHNEWMLYEGGKMSKSTGNGYTIGELIDMGYTPLAFRYFCLNTHYRQKLNFSFASLDSAQTAYLRLLSNVAQHKASMQRTNQGIIDQYQQQFESAIADDLNIPMALGVLFKLLREPKSIDIYNLILVMDRVFGLGLDSGSAPKKSVVLTQQAQLLLEQRQQARADRDYQLSDRLRDQLAQLGYIVKDTKEGQIIQ
ncbi:MAG: cysteine--tRNA ligase [Clostridia bacterium]|nr:cysteine--tRNA ligase [Clostridia bacterium]